MKTLARNLKVRMRVRRMNSRDLDDWIQNTVMDIGRLSFRGHHEAALRTTEELREMLSERVSR